MRSFKFVQCCSNACAKMALRNEARWNTISKQERCNTAIGKCLKSLEKNEITLCLSNLGKEHFRNTQSGHKQHLLFSLLPWNMAATSYATLPAGGRNTAGFLNTLNSTVFPLSLKAKLLIFLIHTYPVANSVSVATYSEGMKESWRWYLQLSRKRFIFHGDKVRFVYGLCYSWISTFVLDVVHNRHNL